MGFSRWVLWLSGSVKALRPGRPRRRRPAVEALEARIVRAGSLTWTGAGPDHLWSDAQNWVLTGTSTHAAPANGDSLTFPASPSDCGRAS
jgi:hypothetical protein